jgi:hypothetical protein
MKVRKLMNYSEILKKLGMSSIAAVLVTGWMAPVARANHLNFTLYNESSYSIWYFYVSPARSNSWGSDVLGRTTLKSGESTPITFTNQSDDSPCIWDVKAVFQDNTNRINRVNLCETRSVTVR